MSNVFLFNLTPILSWYYVEYNEIHQLIYICLVIIFKYRLHSILLISFNCAKKKKQKKTFHAGDFSESTKKHCGRRGKGAVRKKKNKINSFRHAPKKREKDCLPPSHANERIYKRWEGYSFFSLYAFKREWERQMSVVSHAIVSLLLEHLRMNYGVVYVSDISGWKFPTFLRALNRKRFIAFLV